MHAFIIAGATAEKRQTWIDDKLHEWKIGIFDKRELHPVEASIGITDVRAFGHSLVTGAAVGIIWQAERLTIEAQNALLKTLEEPPRHTRIILEAQSLDALLPTILSRCLVTRLEILDTFSDVEHENWLAAWNHLAMEQPGKTLGEVSAIAQSRESAQRWVTCGIEALQKALDTRSSEAIRRLLEAHVQLAANVTPKLVIDLCILGKNTV